MILCCGEALIDMLPRLSQDGEAAFAPHVGGAVFNTARALGRLGVPVSFFSGISRDFFGEDLVSALDESKVGLTQLVRSDRPTTLAFVRLTNGQASYLFYDENSAGRMLTTSDMPHVGDEVQALHFSCISLVAEPCGSAYEALMAREHGRKVLMLDPNIRAAFIADKLRHLARMRRMIAMADIVKLSDEDLAWFGEDGSLAEIAARWLSAGPRIVVITQGAKGAAAFTRNGPVEVPARKVEVADTVGAGDTFNAGLLAYLHERGLLERSSIAAISQDDLAGALDLAMRAAAVTVSRAGANPPWRRELI